MKGLRTRSSYGLRENLWLSPARENFPQAIFLPQKMLWVLGTGQHPNVPSFRFWVPGEHPNVPSFRFLSKRGRGVTDRGETAQKFWEAFRDFQRFSEIFRIRFLISRKHRARELRNWTHEWVHECAHERAHASRVAQHMLRKSALPQCWAHPSSSPVLLTENGRRGVVFPPTVLLWQRSGVYPLQVWCLRPHTQTHAEKTRKNTRKHAYTHTETNMHVDANTRAHTRNCKCKRACERTQVREHANPNARTPKRTRANAREQAQMQIHQREQKK